MAHGGGGETIGWTDRTSCEPHTEASFVEQTHDDPQLCAGEGGAPTVMVLGRPQRYWQVFRLRILHPLVPPGCRASSRPSATSVLRSSSCRTHRDQLRQLGTGVDHRGTWGSSRRCVPVLRRCVVEVKGFRPTEQAPVGAPSAPTGETL